MLASYYQLHGGKVAAIETNTPFPPLQDALTQPNGLLAIGGDLSAERLLNAYQQGIFPWFSEGQPILWWSPDPRMVLFPDELIVSRSLNKRLKKADYEVRYNTAFKQVMKACAMASRPDQDGTWITDVIIEGYCKLHELGYAVSAETWIDNQLVGGLYGVKIGRMFYGESMFHHVTDASKLAFVSLVKKLESEGVEMIDCQMKTAHLASFGAREIDRAEFSQRLAKLIHLSDDPA
ncbi:leucyl/phenylalanyl-tRNA--protein transferase [Methyloradius palustris]|uniref:Leucyl/phenylalanyl-tRNA--protein transferase n=1 Tax=Methyloradius palustris TaxID=2778876 RepID=A0A8D5JW50_9PROT|nr:leucyl/phenylalanyl-tRNA--protein transferase [Methyloradius palustris]BCM24734.1 leucyl/phenylalanyl-tRNA--protein transferase [Methyloradius palustris]